MRNKKWLSLLILILVYPFLIGTDKKPLVLYGGVPGQVRTNDVLVDAASSVLMTIGLSRFKIVRHTRDMTAATGNVSYTGAGFTPKAVIILAAEESGISVGYADGTSATVNMVAVFSYGSSHTWDNATAGIYESVSASQTAILNSLDSDGCTLAWTKAGSPTGTGYLGIVYFR